MAHNARKDDYRRKRAELSRIVARTIRDGISILDIPEGITIHRYILNTEPVDLLVDERCRFIVYFPNDQNYFVVDNADTVRIVQNLVTFMNLCSRIKCDANND